jgi:hypothetical protein
MSDSEEPSTLKRYLVKPTTIAAVGAAGTALMYPKSKLTMSFNGSKVPLWAASGLAIGASSALAEVFHDYVFPHIFHDTKLSEPISLAVAGGVTGGASIGINYLYNNKTLNELGVGNLFLFGAVSEMVGTMVYEKGVAHLIA